MISRSMLAASCVVLAMTGGAAFAAESVPESPTFSKDVAPILNANCVSCHRPGAIGPMSLQSYDEVRPWAKSISKYVGDTSMPPWHADPGFGPWKNDRSLSERDVATVVKWVDQGARQGSKKDLPPTPEFAEGDWTLGAPDYEFAFEETTIPGSGPDQFKNFLHDTEFGEDKWIKSVEILPGDARVVHHVILWQGGDAASEVQGWLDGWAAGTMPTEFEPGTGRLVRDGTQIIGDMHYHPYGEDTIDQTRVGLHFATPEEIEKELINLWVINTDFEIPAGDPNYQARSEHTFAQDSHIVTLTPHLHFRGKDFGYSLVYPDGNVKELLQVSKYDFNWQMTYMFEEPIAAPAGSRIECVAHWDNSEDNPFNPDPTRNVRFGNESFDEMMIGFVDYVVDEGVRPAAKVDPMIAKIAQLNELFPGEIYALNIPGPGGAQSSALYIPREGQGGWYVQVNGVAAKANVFDIVWTGDDFTCKVEIPGQGIRDLEGTENREAEALFLRMQVSETMKVPMKATLAK